MKSRRELLLGATAAVGLSPFGLGRVDIFVDRLNDTDIKIGGSNDTTIEEDALRIVDVKLETYNSSKNDIDATGYITVENTGTRPYTGRIKARPKYESGAMYDGDPEIKEYKLQPGDMHRYLVTWEAEGNDEKGLVSINVEVRACKGLPPRKCKLTDKHDG